MASLVLHGRKLESMFELLGRDENDMTGSLGWTLSQSRSFLDAFLRELRLPATSAHEVEVRLQQYEAGRGFTDIEIELPHKFYVIIEAKRGAILPTRRQLSQYARRKRFRRHSSKSKRLVVISDCNADTAAVQLAEYKGLPGAITPLSWQRVAAIARKSVRKSSNAEKRLIGELLIYLREVTNAAAEKRADSNWVYVLSLSNETPEYSKISFIETVEKKRRYYHPVGPWGGWPVEPPTYLAFRYHGKLESIHYVEKCETLTNLGTRMPEIANEEHDPCFLYYLGPPFRPDHDVPTGDKILRANRVRCMLDTLFTCRTISRAWELSKKRAGRD
jgi:hypothetical protein